MKEIFYEQNPVSRYHVVEYDKIYCDGHHESETEKKPLEITSEKIIRTENRSKYGFMKVTDYYYTMYEVQYIDGTTGKRYSMRVESD